MIVAVDFDGTIVEHAYPIIGKERTNAIFYLKRLKFEFPEIQYILWTCREGKQLEDAVDWCKHKGVSFDAVNSNIVDFGSTLAVSKIYADIYVDDRNLEGIPEWNDIYVRIKSMLERRREKFSLKHK